MPWTELAGADLVRHFIFWNVVLTLLDMGITLLTGKFHWTPWSNFKWIMAVYGFCWFSRVLWGWNW